MVAVQIHQEQEQVHPSQELHFIRKERIPTLIQARSSLLIIHAIASMLCFRREWRSGQNTRFAFGVNATNPVYLEIGPGGDLFYADLIRRNSPNQIQCYKQSTNRSDYADPTFGNPPLFVQFDGSDSTDPDPGATLFYNWDLDGDTI